MRSSKKTGIAALVALVLGIATLAGCTPASTELECTPAALGSAQAELQTARIAANKDGVKGTGSPAEAAAKATVEKAQAKVDQLTTCELEPTEKPTPSTSPTATCPWQMTTADHTNNAWFYEGVAEILSAASPAEAVTAAGVWLEKVRTVPSLFSGAAKVFLDENVDKTTLVEEDNCASDRAVDLYAELALTLANAQSIVPDTVPADAGNSGVENDTVVFEAGVNGDEASRKAVQIVTDDGRVIWIMARCGNLATPGNPGLPEGPTDNHLYPKEPAEDPYANGNANTGGGLNADPGPGNYQSPSQVTQPPSGPRVNPEPPAPIVVTPAPGQSAPVPTRDPAPPPPPEPSAPPSTAPETGCDASVPGVSC